MDTIADFSRKHISLQVRAPGKIAWDAKFERVGYLRLLPISIRRFRIHFLAFRDIQTRLEKIRETRNPKNLKVLQKSLIRLFCNLSYYPVSDP